MKLSIAKSPVPILFIDTSFINKMYKNEYGRKYQMLFSYLRERVTSGDIVCPLGGQDEEVDDYPVEIFTLHSLISLNIEFKDWYVIEQYQLFQMLSLLKNRTDIFRISYQDVFTCNLIDEISKRKSMQILWPYSHKPSNHEIDDRNNSKNGWMNALNEIHKAGYTT